MPHSSGGGSHGGGFHGGSHSSGGSGTYKPAYSNKPYPGAMRYVYYGRHGRMHTFYASEPMPRMTVSSLVVSILIVAFIGTIFCYGMFSSAFFSPRKTDAGSYNSDIVIEDKLDIVDEEKITEAFEEFRELTGVTPALEVVSETELANYHNNMETFAYSEYMRMFDDEKHWLFVICIPEGYEAANFVDWQWEGMIGDDVGHTISENTEDLMTEIMQKYLLRCEVGNMTTAVVSAFAELSETVMEPEIDGVMLFMSCVIALAFLAIIVLSVAGYFNTNKMSEAKPVSEGAKQYSCEYCGCMYFSGTISVCPHCGAAIPAHND